MDTADNTPSAPDRILNMRQAAKLAKVSEVTLRKHLKTGRLKAAKVDGDYGKTWAIEYDTLAAFVRDQYGRRLSLRGASGDTAQPSGVDTLRALRDQLDTTLVELGRSRQLAEGNETTAAEVERILKERIAEVAQERDAALAALDAERRRGFWSRLLG